MSGACGDQHFTGQCPTCEQDCSCQAEANAEMYFATLGELRRLKRALAPTDENVAALAREIERRFGYATGWRARQALEALSVLLARPTPPGTVEVSPGLYVMPEVRSVFSELPPREIRHNGGVRCDMAVGPCACGATHEAEAR